MSDHTPLQIGPQQPVGLVLLATRGPLLPLDVAQQLMRAVGDVAARHGYTGLVVNSAGEIYGRPPGHVGS